jgi:hypothetical protein
VAMRCFTIVFRDFAEFYKAVSLGFKEEKSQ